MNAPFRVALTADFRGPDGTPRYRDVGLSLFDGVTGITVNHFAEHSAEIQPDQLSGVNGVIVLTPKVTARSLTAANDLLAIGRFGVGYDSVDVAACTVADVVLMITTGAVDRPVAEATVGWMLALTHHFRMKDRLVREARWNDRSQYMGCELRERTLGVIGFGGIGRSLVKLLSGFGMNTPLVFDPFTTDEAVSAFGAKRVSLDELLAKSDFVSLNCALTPQNRGLIGEAQFELMKPTAFLINTARGPIVDEAALVEALQHCRISGAGLDVFEHEPAVHPGLLECDNAVLVPHLGSATVETRSAMARLAAHNAVNVLAGVQPPTPIPVPAS